MNYMEAPPIQRVDRTWDVIAHLSALLMFTAIPFGNILGPLIVWLIKRNDSPTAAEHAKESLNFQLSLTLYYIAAIGVSVLLMFVLIGFLLLPIAIGAGIVGMIFDVILIIIAAMRAGNGEMYRYPITIRFVS